MSNGIRFSKNTNSCQPRAFNPLLFRLQPTFKLLKQKVPKITDCTWFIPASQTFIIYTYFLHRGGREFEPLTAHHKNQGLSWFSLKTVCNILRHRVQSVDFPLP